MTSPHPQPNAPSEERLPTVHEILAEAQSEWASPKRLATGQSGREKYKYATIEQIIDLVKEYLNSKGCSYTQGVSVELATDKYDVPIYHVEVRSTLTGPAGDQIVEVTRLPLVGWVSRKEDNWDVKMAPTPKESGSGITYARRYADLGFFNLGQEDDDGTLASADQAGGPAPTPVQYPFFQRNSQGATDESSKWTIVVRGSHKTMDVLPGVETRQGPMDITLLQLVSRPTRGVEEWTFAGPADS